MYYRTICHPLVQNFGLTPLGRTVVYGELLKITEIYKRIRRYPSMLIPPGTDTEKSSRGAYARNSPF